MFIYFLWSGGDCSRVRFLDYGEWLCLSPLVCPEPSHFLAGSQQAASVPVSKLEIHVPVFRPASQHQLVTRAPGEDSWDARKESIASASRPFAFAWPAQLTGNLFGGWTGVQEW